MSSHFIKFIKGIITSKNTSIVLRIIAAVSAMPLIYQGITHVIQLEVWKVFFAIPWELPTLNERSLWISAMLFLLAIGMRARFSCCSLRFSKRRILHKLGRMSEYANTVYEEVLAQQQQCVIGGSPPSNILRARVREVVTQLCSVGAFMIEQVISADVHVCVKKIEDERVRIRGRSKKNGLPLRDQSPEFFKLKDNTAFKHVLETGIPYYLDNNLKKNKNYKNANAEWEKLYTKTLVLGIYTPEGELWGFICADALKGKFDNYECLGILKVVGIQIYRIVEAYDQMRIICKPGKKAG